MKKFFTLLLLVIQATLGHCQNCGPLDPFFGNGGASIGITSNASISSKNLLIQPDNRIIQVFTIYANNHYEFGILRYKIDGQLDSSFGNNGKTTTAMGGSDGYATAGALQSDGKIVVVGSASTSNSIGFGLVRYNSNGTIDNSFGSSGKVIASFGSYYDYATAIAIQADGKILVAGSSADSYYTGAFALARFKINGTFDSSFGQNGKIVTHLGPFVTYIGGQYFGRYAEESAKAVVLQPDGKIILAGTSYTTDGCWDYYGGIYCNPAFAMVRYHSNGIIDSSFGTYGKVTDSVTLLQMSSMTLQNDGKILVLGDGNPNSFITKRYNSNGSIDNNYGIGGTSNTKIAGLNTYHGPRSLAIRADGKIIIGGVLSGNNVSQFAILRNTSNGLPDSSFNGNGTLFFKLRQPESLEEISSVALQGNKIIAGGFSTNNNSTAILALRLLDSGQVLTPIITPDGPLSFCNGFTVKLSSSEKGFLQWYRNNIAIAGATDTVYSATQTGLYTLSATNLKGCGTSSPVSVTVTISFIPSITASGPVTFCAGDHITLTSNAYGGNQWYRDGVAIIGATNQTLEINTNGIYTAKVTANGCESTPSNEIKVTVTNIIPSAPSITASGDTTFCSGTSLVLTSDATTDNQWFKNGVLMNGSTGASLNVNTSGIYTSKVITGGCQSQPSNAIVVRVNGRPNQPLVNWDGVNMSTSSGYAQYQWFFNDTAIISGDSNVYKPTQIGRYKVKITDIVGCSNTSEPFDFVVLGVTDVIVGDAKLRWYPNPAHSLLNVDLINVRNNKLHAELYDVTGRFIKKQLLNKNNNQLTVQGLTTGLYQLIIYNGREKTVVKVMIIN
jgi:uncharacterized delta-60 repeat protein